MASLNHLPFEILTNILFRLACRDLSSASRVSRSLQSVAESVLYKSYSLSTNKIRSFIYTLLSPGREIVGTYVVELTLRLNHSQFLELEESLDGLSDIFDDLSEILDLSDSEEADSDDEYPVGNCDSPDEPTTSLANIESSDLPRDGISSANRRLEYEQLTAAVSRLGLNGPLAHIPFLLLLHLLPNLMRLTIAFPPGVFCFMEQLCTIPVAELPAGLRSLRHFSSRQQGVSPQILCTLLQLPSISTINVHILEKTEEDPDNYDEESPVDPLWTVDEFLSVSSGTSSVTTLQLHCNSLSPDALSHILSIPRALQILSYESDPPHLVDHELARAIVHHQNSLQDLTLECSVWSAIGSLHDWPKLQRVRCSLDTLLGEPHILAQMDDILPRGIKVLDILYDDEWSRQEAVDIVLRLLERKKAMLPGLESIGVRRDEEKGVKNWEMLAAACLEAGVELMDDYVTPQWL